MKASDIIAVLASEILEHTEFDDCEISDIAYDSRRVKQQGAFVCMKGAMVDGHAYIDNAVVLGAKVIVADDEAIYSLKKEQYPEKTFLLVKDSRKALAIISAAHFGYPAKQLKIIGITGTKGKTSTSYMIKEILETFGKKVGIIGTVGISYADKSEYIDNSTPESYELHRIFSDMLSCGIEFVVMEVSSQALMLHRTFGITFDLGLFTNISPDHIGPGEHDSFEQYLWFKGQLFTQCRRAAVNLDSDKSDYIIDIIKHENIPFKTFGAEGTGANFVYKNPKFDIKDELNTSFEFNRCGRIKINILGSFSVYNAIAAITVCSFYGVDLDSIRTGLERVKVVGRVESVKHENCKFAVLIDYAHNALSMESLFEAVNKYEPNRIICVFGCGGNRSKLRRYDMGEIAGKYADLSVLTSDNPRHESVDDIIEDILVGMNKSEGRYIIIKDRKEAIFYALSNANIGDIVLIVGKGNQTYEEIGDEKIPFDERKVIKEYFDNEAR